MSRLTKRNATLKASCKENSTYDCILEDDCITCDCNNKILEKLAHYEDLEEQGRLIELPCKIGDKVYDISDVLNGNESDIPVINVKWITLEEDENGKLYFDISGFDYYPEAFGNVAFLTEEEAYAELSRIFQAMQDELEAEAEWVAMEGGAE